MNYETELAKLQKRDETLMAEIEASESLEACVELIKERIAINEDISALKLANEHLQKRALV